MSFWIRFIFDLISALTKIIQPNGVTSDDGPSWLTFIAQLRDSLWSLDLFRMESIHIKTHWIMLVMDQFSRKIIDLAVHPGILDGSAICRLFNQIISGQSLSKYLSTDHVPLFKFHQWQANLRIIDIEEIKTVPYTPTSHPFVERVIKTIREELLDRVIFFTANDLQRKLNQFQNYYN